MTAKCQINYFKPLENQVDQILLPIKGNFRREFVKSSIENEGIESVPPAWLNHNLSSVLSNFLQAQHPQARGGEDLPDLFINEIEIARVTYTNTIHREVVSLRAFPTNDNGEIKLRIVDEYASDIQLPYDKINNPLDPEALISLFLETDPNQVGDGDIEYYFQSFFYDDLNSIASSKGINVAQSN